MGPFLCDFQTLCKSLTFLNVEDKSTLVLILNFGSSTAASVFGKDSESIIVGIRFFKSVATNSDRPTKVKRSPFIFLPTIYKGQTYFRREYSNIKNLALKVFEFSRQK